MRPPRTWHHDNEKLVQRGEIAFYFDELFSWKKELASMNKNKRTDAPFILIHQGQFFFPREQFIEIKGDFATLDQFFIIIMPVPRSTRSSGTLQTGNIETHAGQELKAGFK